MKDEELLKVFKHWCDKYDSENHKSEQTATSVYEWIQESMSKKDIPWKPVGKPYFLDERSSQIVDEKGNKLHGWFQDYRKRMTVKESLEYKGAEPYFEKTVHMKSYIRYYLIRNNKPHKTLEELEEEHLKELTKYYHEYGKDGFLSERLDLESIPSKARGMAKQSYSEKGGLLISSAFIEKEEDIKKYEKEEGFYKWLDDLRKEKGPV